MRYTLILAIFAAFTLACSDSPQPARSPAPVVETQPPAPSSEPPAPAEAAPIPSDASNGDVSGLYIFKEGEEARLPPPRILPVFQPRPLDEEACEIYGPTDDEDGLKILAPGDPEYERRVELSIAMLQAAAREGTPPPMLEDEIERLPYLIDCLERARE